MIRQGTLAFFIFTVLEHNKFTNLDLKTLFRKYSHQAVSMGCLVFCFFLYSTPNLILADGGQPLPGNLKIISLSKIKVRVIDGDTFDADIDRNGFFSNPEERIRLLYVDTPELSESHKGKDSRNGLTAKAFLKSGLLNDKAVLRVDPKNRKGDYGRLLAILDSGGIT